jgi:hypothetical protein
MHVETWAIFDHFWVIFGHLRVISMFGARVWEYLSESIHSRSMFRLSTIFNDSLHLHWGLLNVHRRVWRSPRRWWAKHVGISRISLCFPTWCLMISCFSPCFIMFYYIFLMFYYVLLSIFFGHKRDERDVSHTQMLNVLNMFWIFLAIGISQNVSCQCVQQRELRCIMWDITPYTLLLYHAVSLTPCNHMQSHWHTRSYHRGEVGNPANKPATFEALLTCHLLFTMPRRIWRIRKFRWSTSRWDSPVVSSTQMPQTESAW